MATEGKDDVVIPSNPTERAKLKTMLEEIVGCMRRADDERVSIKDIKAEIKDQFKIGPKYSGRLAKTMYAHSYSEVVAENDEFVALYESIIGAPAED